MKNFTLFLSTALLLVVLSACQPTGSVLPIEQVTPSTDSLDTTTATNTQDSSEIPLDSSTLVDTVADSSISRTFLFANPEAEKLFSEYLATLPATFTITVEDSLYHISYTQDTVDTAALLETIIPISFVEVDLAEPVIFLTGQSMTLYSPFNDLSHIEQLFLSTDTAVVEVSKSNSSTLLLKTKGTDLDAFFTSTALSEYAGAHPARLQAIMGPLKGLKNFIEGYESVVQGINPGSTQELELSYPRRAPHLEQQSLQLLHHLGFPYRGVEKASTPTQSLLSYIGDTAQPHFEKILVEHSSDRDPLIELSTGKGDGILLYQQENIALVKRRFSSLELFEVDRRAYFIGMNKISDDFRGALTKTLSPVSIALGVTTPTTPISSLQTGLLDTVSREESEKSYEMPTEVKLLLDPTDAIALETARNITTLLRKAGIKVTRMATSYEEYQYALVAKEYDIVIGAVSHKLAQTELGQLYIARYWFRSLKNEEMRLRENYEIPLFTVPVYLALKDGIKVPEENLRAIYKKQ